jgi:hypothetical protein
MPIRFSDIQTSDLLYYDPDLKEICLHFCQDRNIDCLPSLDDPMMLYRRTETGFVLEAVTPERMVDSRAFIFDQPLLERFRTNHLLFVYENKELTGVVHFSDYNRPAVSEYLFSLFSSYERSLRKLLILSGLANKDMLDRFQRVVAKTKNEKSRAIYTQKIGEYEKDRLRNEKLPEFERFYLRDLIELINDQKIIKVSDKVNQLRNDIMHVHELVNMYDAHREDYIYSYASFKDFFELVIQLIYDFKRVNNRIAFSDIKVEK